MINGRRRDVTGGQRAVLPPCDWLAGGASAARRNTGPPACLPGPEQQVIVFPAAAQGASPTGAPPGCGIPIRVEVEGSTAAALEAPRETEERCCTALVPRCQVAESSTDEAL